jgi:hypothetical protein
VNAWDADFEDNAELERARRQRTAFALVAVLLLVATMIAVMGTRAAHPADAATPAALAERAGEPVIVTPVREVLARNRKAAACTAAQARFTAAAEAVDAAAAHHVTAHIAWKQGKLRIGTYERDFAYALSHGRLRPGARPTFLGMVGIFAHDYRRADTRYRSARASLARAGCGTAPAAHVHN